MSITTRSGLRNSLTILKNDCKDPEVKQRYRLTSKKYILQGVPNRLFDDFSSLISGTELNNQVWLFKLLLNKISCHENENEQPLSILTGENKYQLSEAIINIAIMGYHSFISDNRMDPELIELLDWSNLEKKIDICDLLCAYVGRILNDVMLKITESNQNIDWPAMNGMTNYINKNYRGWVKTALKRAGHPYEEKIAASEESGYGYGASTLFSIGVATLAILSGAAFFGSRSRRQTPEPEEDELSRWHYIGMSE